MYSHSKNQIIKQTNKILFFEKKIQTFKKHVQK